MSLIAAHWIMCSAVNDQPGHRPLDDSAARVHGDATLLSWLADDLQGHLQPGRRAGLEAAHRAAAHLQKLLPLGAIHPGRSVGLIGSARADCADCGRFGCLSDVLEPGNLSKGSSPASDARLLDHNRHRSALRRMTPKLAAGHRRSQVVKSPGAGLYWVGGGPRPGRLHWLEMND